MVLSSGCLIDLFHSGAKPQQTQKRFKSLYTWKVMTTSKWLKYYSSCWLSFNWPNTEDAAHHGSQVIILYTNVWDRFLNGIDTAWFGRWDFQRFHRDGRRFPVSTPFNIPQLHKTPGYGTSHLFSMFLNQISFNSILKTQKQYAYIISGACSGKHHYCY